MAVCSECVHKAVTHLGWVCEKRKAQLWVLSSVGVCVCLMGLCWCTAVCVCVCTYSILMYSAAVCLAERHILCCLATWNILPTDLLSEKQTACSLILLPVNWPVTSVILHQKHTGCPVAFHYLKYIYPCVNIYILFSRLFFRSFARLVTVLVWIRLK